MAIFSCMLEIINGLRCYPTNFGSIQLKILERVKKKKKITQVSKHLTVMYTDKAKKY